MTKSKLCTYTHLTNNCSSRKGNSIKKVTVHYMCAKWTGKQCADYFASTGRQASSNYCVGWNGGVAMSVDEDMRAWTSSSWWNDKQAITIEVGNLSNGSITENAWNDLVALCADICKRYGITPSYDGTKNATFTEHRMFASTDCPGWYIHQNMSRLVKEVKAKMADEKPKVTVPTEKNGIYRLYNGKLHMLTADHGEAESLANSGWTYEGVAFHSGSGAYVYRFYNKYTGCHMFTESVSEVGALVINGWTYEGPAFKQGTKNDVYRLYNKSAAEHLFTSSTTEHDNLVAAGWIDEGVGFKAD